MAKSKGTNRVTTDHDTIRKWAEDRGGKPATVAGTPREGEKAGLLRIDFPGYSGEESLREVAWEDFFEQFDKSNLALIYQEKTASDETSRFAKFVDRDSVDED